MIYFYKVTSEKTILWVSCSEYSPRLTRKKLHFRLIKALKWQLSTVFLNNKRLYSPAGILQISPSTNISAAIRFLSRKHKLNDKHPGASTRKKKVSSSSTCLFKSYWTLKALHCYHCPHHEKVHAIFFYLPSILYFYKLFKQMNYSYFWNILQSFIFTLFFWRLRRQEGTAPH